MQIGDYEHSSHGFLNLSADWAVVPDVIPVEAVQMDRARSEYPGIKEDVYVPGFKPNPAIKAQLGILESDLVVTIRPRRMKRTIITRRATSCFMRWWNISPNNQTRR